MAAASPPGPAPMMRTRFDIAHPLGAYQTVATTMNNSVSFMLCAHHGPSTLNRTFWTLFCGQGPVDVGGSSRNLRCASAYVRLFRLE